MLTPALATKLATANGQFKLHGLLAEQLPLLVPDMATQAAAPLVLIARDHAQLVQWHEQLQFLMGEGQTHIFPAWDTQPYDRQPPDAQLQAQRAATLHALAKQQVKVLVTSTNAMVQRVVPATQTPQAISVQQGKNYDPAELVKQLVGMGYQRVNTVLEAGEVAQRGGIVDVFPPLGESIRLDFFDDELDQLHTFDPLNQRTEQELKEALIVPAAELVPGEAEIATFRAKFREHFSTVDDPLYVALSSGQRPSQWLHYLPFFVADELPLLTDILPEESIYIAAHDTPEAMQQRFSAVNEMYLLREEDRGAEQPYRPVPPQSMFASEEELEQWQQTLNWRLETPFSDGEKTTLELPLHTHEFVSQSQPQLAYKQAAEHIDSVLQKGGRVILSAQTQAALTRLERGLAEAGVAQMSLASDWQSAQKGPRCRLALSALGRGYVLNNQQLSVLTAQDVTGVQEQRRVYRKRRSKDADMVQHFSELAPGDYVVHEEHGVGRFEGLITMDVGGGVQDFLHLTYTGDDRLYVPVDALEVISRHSSAEAGAVSLDKLGGAAWQARKAKAKADLMEMADAVVGVAAEREMMSGHAYPPPDGLYEEFCVRFGHEPTPEQQRTFDEVQDDLTSGRAMDRLVVGDVGFGKTEVALRAAFLAAAGGKQVAVLCPTTLLARQHLDVFKKRFADFPFNVRGLSRLTPAKEVKETKERLKSGGVDIVVGTHALLAKSIQFKSLGLLVVDEEQRFGVAHKERLKELKANVDVLTLTATPIPRTLQQSLGGMRQLSTITTPPVDRLAIRSYVTPFDGPLLREAVMRELHRGGQVYVVTPRIEDIPELRDTIERLVPEVSLRVAHGQMPEQVLDRTMTDFYDNKFQLLIATTIIESGIDVARANTMIINRADRFGLAQLYQLRGRVGRSNVRAYAYFLLPPRGVNEQAERRLRILQRLNGLGAGFMLASYDMDLRGAGNLLGKQQSGHIREVGFELYQKLLNEALAAKRRQQQSPEAVPEVVEDFVPQLSLGVSYLIPERYVPDPATRMQLYRRLAQAKDAEAITDFADELKERFGQYPDDVTRLLQVMTLRNQCRVLNIAKLEVGDKGAVVAFHNNQATNPVALMQFIQAKAGQVSVRPDQRLVLHSMWGADAQKRLAGLDKWLNLLYESLNEQEKAA